MGYRELQERSISIPIITRLGTFLVLRMVYLARAASLNKNCGDKVT